MDHHIRQSLPICPRPVAEADPFFGLPGVRVEYELGGELDPANRVGSEELDPRIGSPQAGPKVAAILSIFETCRRIKLPVREYLSAVLPGLANPQLQRLPDLTPTAWAGQP
jgi:hypothetical protein